MSPYRRSLTIGGTIFFTVTLADRSSRLPVDHIDRLHHALATTPSRRPFLAVAIRVPPNHLHAVWQLPEGDADLRQRWESIKRLFAADFDAAANRSVSKLAKRQKSIWQWRVWEHAIRDDTDLARHTNYIHFIPVKHGHAACPVD